MCVVLVLAIGNGVIWAAVHLDSERQKKKKKEPDLSDYLVALKGGTKMNLFCMYAVDCMQ